MRPLRRAAVSFAVLVGLLVPSEGRAQTVGETTEEACARAARDAQTFRGAGQYARARSTFAACGAASCPDAVRAFCVTALQKVDEEAPTIVIVARDGAGREIADVRVWVDGVYTADRIDGRPLSLDPGAHRLRFERAGIPPVERDVVVRVGEKARPVAVIVGASPSAATKATPAPDPARPVPALSWALGGAGVIGLGSFSYFALRGWGERSDLADAPCHVTATCDVSGVRTSWYIADVSLVVAALAMGGAVWAYLAPAVAPRAIAPRAAGPDFTLHW
jgi:hypothetical protein